MNRISDIEGAHFDVEEFRNIQRQAFHLELPHNRLENAAADNAGRLADKVKRYMHLDLCREIHLIKVCMHDVTGNRVILHVLNQGHFVRQSV